MNNIIDDKSALTLLLSSSSNNYDASVLATRLCSKFGNLYNIVNADEEQLFSVKGMNEKKLKSIKSLPNILQSYLKSTIVSSPHHISTYKDVMRYFMLTMRDLKFEVFSYAIFDIKKRVLDIGSIFRGSISSATIYPREIIDIALSKKARYIVVSHNHPSGNAKPSDQDIVLTKDLYQICSSIQIELMDHIIIARNKRYSFRKEGLIDFFKESNPQKNNTHGEYYA